MRVMSRSAHWFLIIVSGTAVLMIFAYSFERFPIEGTTLAIDWKGFWPSLKGGNLQYLSLNGPRFPPWSAVPLLPLGFLPMRTAWGVLIGVSTIILVVSVPRVDSKVLHWLSIFLLAVSFPALRNSADGNVEGIVVGGVLLLISGYHRMLPYIMTAGVLVATIKMQEVTLLVIVSALYVLQTWAACDWLRAGLFGFVIVILSLLWRGKSWIIALLGPNYQKYTNSIIDIGIIGAFKRLGVVPPFLIALVWITILGVTLFVAWKSRPKLSREKAGMLIAGSILIAPYAAGNSVLTLLAIGIIPLFQGNLLLGGALIALINLPFLFSADMLYRYQAYYWTAVVTLTWGILAWRSYSSSTCQPKSLK